VKRPRSLKARALQWLAQREHSRPELRRKLLAHARFAGRGEASPPRRTDEAPSAGAPDDSRSDGAGIGSVGAEAVETRDGGPGLEQEVDAILDWLETRRLLSAERFAESRIHARVARFGNLRIRQELGRHDIRLAPEAAQALADSELERARAVCRRRFSEAPSSVNERGRQARFLAARGFSAEVIRRVLRDAAACAEGDEA
jgi:regulatory protein